MTKKIFILVILVAAIVVGGYFLINQEKTLKNPEAVQDMIRIEENMNNLDSYTTAVEVEMKFNNEADDKIYFTADVDVDRKNNAMKAIGSMVASVEGINFDLAGELIHVNDNLYGRINNINLPPILFLFLPIDQSKIELITGKNILLKENLFRDLNEFIAEIMQEIDLDSLTIEEIIEEMEEISKSFWQKGIMIVEDVSVDELDGQEVNKYTIKIDDEKLTEFILNYVNNLLDSIPATAGQDKQEIIKEVEKAMEELEEAMKEDQPEMDIYIWADKDHILKLSYYSEIKIPEEERQKTTGAPEEIIVTMNIYYSNFNHEFEITEPEDYMLLEELMKIFEDIFDIQETETITIEPVL